MTSNIKDTTIYILKLALFVFLEVLILFLLAPYIGILNFPDFQTAFIMVISLSIINALLWPILSYISLRFLILTMGFGSFLLDGLLLRLMSYFIPSLYLEGWSLFTIPLLIGIINGLLSIVLGMDHGTYYNYVLKNTIERTVTDIPDKKGYIYLEIDGLAHDVLLDAINHGYMPTLRRWIDEGSHKLISWQTDLSSQTGSSQAGILHGNNRNIISFRWVEKENDDKIVTVNKFSDSKYIENVISDGNGLLSDNGASRSNLFSGDAEDNILTFSHLVSFSSLFTTSWYYLYSSPYFIARLLVLFLGDMLAEFISRIIHLVRNIRPRLRFRGLKYYVARAGANVVMREASTYSILGDIYEGTKNAIYTTYMGYDEIAHHSGIRNQDSYRALESIDSQIEKIENAIKDSKRDYDIVILSDHGQSNGPTFKMKYGYTLKDLVEDNLPEDIVVHSILHSNDDHFLQQFELFKPKETIRNQNVVKRISELRSELRNNRLDNNILLSNTPVIERIQSFLKSNGINIDLSRDVVSIDEVQSIVLASGNLGLIYFTDWSERLTYEQLEDAFPGLVSTLANHPGIGFVMVRSSIFGTMILKDDNIYYLGEDKYVGDHFLDNFGTKTIGKLKRTDSFDHVPDILVNSEYDEVKDEVYAFEELIGSHGGAGGTQQYPFILHPSSWDDHGSIYGAENVYKFFKKNMDTKEK
ncbi:MAG: phage holin family protein [Methanosphaera sp.]|nr:phage holin family protein [Methanosphaera sp.]